MTAGVTNMTDLWVVCLLPWDQLRWMLAANSTQLSDDQGLKHFNFEYVILHSPCQDILANNLLRTTGKFDREFGEKANL